MKCDCEFVRQQLSAYIDGMLSNEEQTRVSEHIASCEECRGEYEFLFAISKTAGELPKLTVSDKLHNRIMQNVLETPKKHVVKRPLWKLVSAAAAMAAVIAVSVVSFSSLPGHPDLATEDTPGVMQTADVTPEDGENSKNNELQQMPEGRTVAEQTPSPVQYAENETLTVAPASIPAEELPAESNQGRSIPGESATTDNTEKITLSIAKEQAQKVVEILSIYEKIEEGYLIPLEEKERILAEFKALSASQVDGVEQSEETEIVEFVIICK